jgi:hypothetical protein
VRVHIRCAHRLVSPRDIGRTRRPSGIRGRGFDSRRLHFAGSARTAPRCRPDDHGLSSAHEGSQRARRPFRPLLGNRALRHLIEPAAPRSPSAGPRPFSFGLPSHGSRDAPSPIADPGAGAVGSLMIDSRARTEPFAMRLTAQSGDPDRARAGARFGTPPQNRKRQGSASRLCALALR